MRGTLRAYAVCHALVDVLWARRSGVALFSGVADGSISQLLCL